MYRRTFFTSKRFLLSAAPSEAVDPALEPFPGVLHFALAGAESVSDMSTSAMFRVKDWASGWELWAVDGGVGRRR
jgi:hypothetical protein